MKLEWYFDSLLHLRAVLEHGSMNKAAAVIGLTQPSITRSIARLEAAVGVKLVTRSALGVTATTFGEGLLTHIVAIEAELEHAAITLDNLRGGGEGLVACGGTAVPVVTLIPAAIRQLQTTNPKVRVRVVENNPDQLLAMLRLGQLDLVIGPRVMDAPPETDLIEETLAVDQIGIFARADHPLASAGSLRLSDLAARQQWIMPLPGDEQFRSISSFFSDHRVGRPTQVVEAHSVNLILKLLQDTDMLAIITSRVIGAHLKGRVRKLEGNWTMKPVRTMLYARQNTIPTTAVKRFAETIRQTADSASFQELAA